MRNKYEVLRQVLEKFDAYEQELSDNELSLAGFSAYLSGGASSRAIRVMGGDREPEITQRGNNPETSIAILVAHMYRYAKLYGKKALQNTPLRSIDDFSYLIVLITFESLTKKELIQKNVHEKTTGIEIINRLLKMGLVKQTDNETDKRSRRITITPEGKAAIYGALGNLGKVSRIVSGNLTGEEKKTLTDILVKLDHFHHDIYTCEKELDLDKIIRKRLDSIA